MDDRGFTMIEMLVALLITCFCFQLLVGIVTQTLRYNEHLKDMEIQEWHLCLNQLDYYLNNPKVEITGISRPSITVVDKENENAESYVRKYGVGKFGLQPGNRPFMVKVKYVNFYVEGQYIRLEIDMISGKKFSGRIFLPKYLNKERKEDEK